MSRTDPRIRPLRLVDDLPIWHEGRRTDGPALLPCTRCGVPTRHALTGRRVRVTSRGPTDTVEVIYACGACQSSRVWGVECT